MTPTKKTRSLPAAGPFLLVYYSATTKIIAFSMRLTSHMLQEHLIGHIRLIDINLACDLKAGVHGQDRHTAVND